MISLGGITGGVSWNSGDLGEGLTQVERLEGVTHGCSDGII